MRFPSLMQTTRVDSPHKGVATVHRSDRPRRQILGFEQRHQQLLRRRFVPQREPDPSDVSFGPLDVVQVQRVLVQSWLYHAQPVTTERIRSLICDGRKQQGLGVHIRVVRFGQVAQRGAPQRWKTEMDFLRPVRKHVVIHPVSSLERTHRNWGAVPC
jgi:hypothetical protein